MIYGVNVWELLAVAGILFLVMMGAEILLDYIDTFIDRRDE